VVDIRHLFEQRQCKGLGSVLAMTRDAQAAANRSAKHIASSKSIASGNGRATWQELALATIQGAVEAVLRNAFASLLEVPIANGRARS
jgi:hypothetical protein